jgi:hypothetical protein
MPKNLKLSDKQWKEWKAFLGVIKTREWAVEFQETLDDFNGLTNPITRSPWYGERREEFTE